METAGSGGVVVISGANRGIGLAIAKEFQAKHGGTLGNFNDALRESYLGMAEDVAMIRKNREERRKRAAEAKKS